MNGNYELSITDYELGTAKGKVFMEIIVIEVIICQV